MAVRGAQLLQGLLLLTICCNVLSAEVQELGEEENNQPESSDAKAQDPAPAEARGEPAPARDEGAEPAGGDEPSQGERPAAGDEEQEGGGEGQDEAAAEEDDEGGAADGDDGQ